MKHPVAHLLGLVICCLGLALPAQAELPARDLTVALRQVEDAGGVTIGTQSREPLLAMQQVRVRNGAKASLRLSQSIPMQWVQSASSQSESLSAGGATASKNGGSVNNALVWMDAGQSLTVQPRWSGQIRQAVTVEIEVQSAAVGDRVGADLPTQARSHMNTTVSAPLGEWVTIATTGGGSAPPGVYGTGTVGESRRLLQLRVLAP